MIKSILDPPIPYIEPIPTTIIPGKLIRIQGTVPGIAYRFNINLQCGIETSPVDIALHVGLNVLDGFITLNALQFGNWGEEQLISTSPIKRSERFEILLICEFNQFKIIFNEQRTYEFPERIHYDRITHLAIDGDVSIIKISYETLLPKRLVEASSSNSQPSAPREFLDEFGPVLIRTATAPQKMRPSSVPDASAPPSYTEATSGSLGQLSSIRPTPNNPPYLTNNAVGIPFPTQGTMIGGSASIGINIPLDNNPSSSASPPEAPVPLNAPSSTFRPIRRMTTTQRCNLFWCIFGVVLIILSIVILVPLRVLNIITPRSPSY